MDQRDRNPLTRLIPLLKRDTKYLINLQLKLADMGNLFWSDWKLLIPPNCSRIQTYLIIRGRDQYCSTVGKNQRPFNSRITEGPTTLKQCFHGERFASDFMDDENRVSSPKLLPGQACAARLVNLVTREVNVCSLANRLGPLRGSG